MAKPFRPDQFTATKFDTTEAKATFANHFVRFVEGGFKRTLFHKKFYTRLSMIFDHIAHSDINGFYATWFETEEDRLRFLERVQSYTPVGDPEWTYSDVERALQQYLKDNPDVMNDQFKKYKVEDEIKSKESARQMDKSMAIEALQRLGPADRDDILKTLK